VPDQQFHGRVESIGTVAEAGDWFSTDVRTYGVMVSVDEVNTYGLKPDMGAEVKIQIGDTLQNVVTIPLQAIFGGTELGGKRKCLVLTPKGPEQREIIIGMN